MKSAFERQGGVIDQSSEAQRYLDHRGANAATLNEGTILLRPAPTPTEVFEEFIHVGQYRHGKIAGSGDVRPAEIEAAQKLIRNRGVYQIPNSETRQTIQRLRELRG